MEDIVGGIEVCMHNDTAGLACEDASISLPCLEASAQGAALGSVPGRNILNGNSFFLPFVDKEFLKLVKSPVGEEPVLFMPMPCLPDAVQVLQDGNPISSDAVYNLSTDAVVHIPHKTFLFPTDLGQMPSRGTSAFALQTPAQTNITPFDFPDVLAVHKPAIGSGDKIVDAPVYSKDVSCFSGDFCWGFHGDHKPELSIPAFHQVAFLGLPAKVPFEVFADGELHLDAPLDGEDGSRSLFKIDVGTPIVKMDCLSIEDRLCSNLAFPVRLDFSLAGGAGILVCDYGQLGRKAELLPELGIGFMVDLEGVGFLFLEADTCDEILAFCNLGESSIKFIDVRGKNFHFTLHCSHHTCIKKGRVFKAIGVKNCNPQFFPCLKTWVSLRGIL